MTGRRSLRTRMLVAFVALAFGVVAVAGATTYLLVRSTAKQNAISDLEKKFGVVETGTRSLRKVFAAEFRPQAGRPRVNAIAAIALVLRLGNARAVFLQNGSIIDGNDTRLRLLIRTPETAQAYALPDPLARHVALLLPDALSAGDSVTGSIGSTVFLARPSDLFPQKSAILGQPVIILTTQLKTNVVGRAGPLFLVAGGATLLIAMGIAFWLARRMTKPVREIQETARRLAAGDLSARASLPEHADDEVASLATTLNTMAEQLEHARGAERAFLLSISHDLRTPLTSIRGYAEALGDGTLDDSNPEARKRAASVITAEARRLERLVRDLLDLSRLDSHQFSLRPRPCDAAEVVSDAAEAFVPAASDMGVVLAVQRNGIVDADVDADRLAQIVANLVENALKYATARVDVSVEHDGTALTITVADDGPGVPADDVRRVFERLYTGRGAAGRAVGTGLGLAIVRELAHAMGGDASVEGENGGGARFVVRVPISR
ncbi:MAG: integral rane sensor signal transduction histidine kinase [Actinomycetia bacterium]|nr:integral rane sensor signal transduction histidine kinase [Actinomycetes bacterium]